jgi:hypothetical protein
MAPFRNGIPSHIVFMRASHILRVRAQSDTAAVADFSSFFPGNDWKKRKNGLL